MIINIALSGSNGRMGKAISKAVALDPEINIAIKLIKNSELDLDQALRSAQVLVDFSTPRASIEYLAYCKRSNIPMVIGTTGFTEEQIKQLAAAAENLPIFLAPNMSIGMSIFQQIIELLSKNWVLYNNFANTKIELTETHHKSKKDQPSGTALFLAKIIEKNFNPAILSGSKLPVTITSKRVGKVKGKHQVICRNDLEEIKLCHTAKNRSIFAQGALLAAKWLVQQKAGRIYNFSDLIN